MIYFHRSVTTDRFSGIDRTEAICLNKKERIFDYFKCIALKIFAMNGSKVTSLVKDYREWVQKRIFSKLLMDHTLFEKFILNESLKQKVGRLFIFK